MRSPSGNDQFRAVHGVNPMAVITDSAVSQLLNAEHDPAVLVETIVAEGTPVVWVTDKLERQWVRFVLGCFGFQPGFIEPTNAVVKSSHSIRSPWLKYQDAQPSLLDTLFGKSRKTTEPLEAQYHRKLSRLAWLLKHTVGWEGSPQAMARLDETGLVVFTTADITGMAYGFHAWLLHQVNLVAKTPLDSLPEPLPGQGQGALKKSLGGYQARSVMQPLLNGSLSQADQVIRTLSLEETLQVQQAVRQEMEALSCIQRIMEAVTYRRAGRLSARQGTSA